jgi:DNA-binding NarL/FixJ family response regulator
MKKSTKNRKHRCAILEHRRKQARVAVRLQKVLKGLELGYNVNEISKGTGMAVKTIKKTMNDNSAEVTYVLLTRHPNVI